jgi:hypothetical protein
LLQSRDLIRGLLFAFWRALIGVIVNDEDRPGLDVEDHSANDGAGVGIDA